MVIMFWIGFGFGGAMVGLCVAAVFLLSTRPQGVTNE